MRAAAATPICPLFLRPEGGSPRSDELLLGMEADILGIPRPGWAELSTEYRYTGFARVSDLCRGGQADLWSRLPKAVVLRSFTDLLSAPNLRSPVLLTLPRGALVSPAGEPKDGWQPVRLPGGGRGYAWADHLAPWPPASGRDEAHLRDGLARAALDYLGAPYRWGGKTPLGIDCSGLVSMAYRLAGITIFRDAAIDPAFPIREIPPARLGRGDLIYFPGHVAMYLGSGQYIHATAAGGGVVLGSLTPGAEGFRPDLAESIVAYGSVF